jgi:phosphate transport system substrate-binding protein
MLRSQICNKSDIMLIKYFLFAAVVALSSNAISQPLTGAGSTFAAPLYAAVSEKLGNKAQYNMTYASVGSSEGLRRLQAKQVDFGASDRPLTRQDLATNGYAQYPTAVGGVALVANLPGIKVQSLKLDGLVIADIFQGNIKQWNDPRIASLNSGVTLPALSIKAHVREAGSGTTFLFTSYLSKVSAGWKAGQGVSSQISTPGLSQAKGNGGVVQAVVSQPGALGYVEYSYAKDNKLDTLQIKNEFGSFVSASTDSITAAVRAADWELLFMDTNPSFEINTINVACPACWPIVGMTYVVVPRRWAESAKAGTFLRFLESMLNEGDEIYKEENYIPLPSRVKNLVKITIRNQLSDGKGNRLKLSQEPDSGFLAGISSLGDWVLGLFNQAQTV